MASESFREFLQRTGDAPGVVLGDLIEERLGERTPEHSGHRMDLGLNLVRASGSFVKMAEEKTLRPRDLRWGGFAVLFMVWMFPGSESRDLARLVGVTKQAVSQVLGTLERDGLIERRRDDPQDQRLQSNRLTEHGAQVLKEAMAAHARGSAEWFGRLDEGEQDELNRLLRKLLG